MPLQVKNTKFGGGSSRTSTSPAINNDNSTYNRSLLSTPKANTLSSTNIVGNYQSKNAYQGSTTSDNGTLNRVNLRSVVGWTPTANTINKDPSSGKPDSGSPGSSNGTDTSTSNYYQMLADYYRQQNEQARQSALDSINSTLNANVTAYNNAKTQAEATYDNLIKQNENNYNAYVDDANTSYNNAIAKNQNDYNAYIDDTNNSYQSLVNQNEVNRYRTQASIREALSNRGQLDTGLGRQEQLNATASNTANLTNILNNKQSAINTARNDLESNNANLLANLQSALTTARNDKESKNSEYNLQKQSTLDEIANAILQLQAQAEQDKASVNSTYTQALADWVAKQTQ